MKRQPTPVFLPEEFHRQRSPVGYSPWDHRELDTTELLALSLSLHFTICNGLLRWLNNKEPACQCRRHRRHVLDPWVRKIPCKKKWQPIPVFLPGKSHGERSWGGGCFSPQDCRVEQDLATEHTHTHHQFILLYASIYANFFFLPWNIFPSHLHPYHYFPPPIVNSLISTAFTCSCSCKKLRQTWWLHYNTTVLSWRFGGQNLRAGLIELKPRCQQSVIVSGDSRRECVLSCLSRLWKPPTFLGSWPPFTFKANSNITLTSACIITLLGLVAQSCPTLWAHRL